MPAGTSLDTIQRIIDADVAYTVSRMQVLERLPGNPIGIAYRTIDDRITALMARHLPSPSFNRVVGLRAGDEPHIAPLAAWYRDDGGTARFDMVPGHFDAALGRELARLGFHHSGFHAALVCGADAPITTGDVAGEAVTSAAMMEEFLQAYMAGWSLPEKDHTRFKANVRPWLDQPGWSLYLARVDGRPAAAATLYVHDKTAYLADAATDPACRGRGLHTALLASRIADARNAGADLVFSGATFLSDSYRNMERIGMRLAFMRAIWTPLVVKAQ
jgi:ribosomal protein S18 acetylase RimI-like enzyme